MGQYWTPGEPELYATPEGCWVWPPQAGCQKVGLVLTVPQEPQSQHPPSPLQLFGSLAAQPGSCKGLGPGQLKRYP